MTIKNRILVMINFFFAVNMHASEVPFENFISNLRINELNQNVDVSLLKKNEKFYIKCVLLSERNIDPKILIRLEENQDYCSVSNDQIQSVFDEESQEIRLSIPGQYFIKKQYGGDEYDYPQKASLGGFINYELQYDRSETVDGYHGLVDLGIFKDYWFLKNSIMYKGSYSNEIIRLDTSLDIDFPNHMSKLTLGDSTTVSNSLMNSLRFGGINWGTNYLERPSFIYWNTPQIQGTARLPSTIELYINGLKIYNQKVSPGDYILNPGSNINYTGNAQVVVEDVLGNRSVQILPILVDNRLLRKGLSEYNIGLGKLRYNYSTSEDEYRDFFTNFYYRRGFTERTSIGTNILYTSDIQNAGIIWTQGLPAFIILDTLVLGSHNENHNSFLYGLSFSKEFNYFAVGFSSRYTDKNFKYVGDENEEQTSLPKFQNLIFLSFTDVPFLHNLNINYSEQNFYKNSEFDIGDEKIFNIGFNRRLGRNTTFGLSYFNRFGEIKDIGGIFSLSYNWDLNNRMYFNHSTDENTNINYVYDNNQPIGFNYAVGLNKRQDDNIYNFNGTLKTLSGDVNVQYYHYEDNDEWSIGYRGGIAFLEGQFNLTKSIDNAFALVKLDNYSDVEVLAALNRVGKTNKKGYAFVHDIVPYVPYEIGFNENQLPIEEKYSASFQTLIALRQRGYIVNFPLQRTFPVVLLPQDIQSKLFRAGSEVHLENGDVYPITSDGTVTIYGMTSGQHKITIQYGDNAFCSVDLNLDEELIKDSTQPLRVVCK